MPSQVTLVSGSREHNCTNDEPSQLQVDRSGQHAAGLEPPSRVMFTTDCKDTRASRRSTPRAPITGVLLSTLTYRTEKHRLKKETMCPRPGARSSCFGSTGQRFTERPAISPHAGQHHVAARPTKSMPRSSRETCRHHNTSRIGAPVGAVACIC